jgi:peptidoglycan/LPS O-acetylase OafA/YrhL
VPDVRQVRDRRGGPRERSTIVSWATLAATIEDRTPADRDRVVDLLRVAAILVVVAGHWLIAVVTVQDGAIHGDNLLAVVPPTQWLTWLLQVMPIFFFVGGRVNAAGWDRARARGSPAASWVRARAARLLRPVLPLLVVWVVLTWLLAAVDVAPDLLRLGTQVVLTPVWFLAVYLGVVALVPITRAADHRWPLTTLGVFLLGAIVADGARRAGSSWVGWANFLWVWGGVHQLGYAWHDGRLPRGWRAGLALVGVCLVLLLVLTEAFGYPRSMVGVPGAVETNNTPPTVALLALAGLQVGGIIVFRDSLAAWLARPRVWAVVSLLGRRALTLFLWHQTAMVAVIGATYPTGLWPASERVDVRWWITRPLWFVLLVSVLLVLIWLFGRFEAEPRRARRPRGATSGATVPVLPSTAVVIGSVLAVTLGLAFLALEGLYVPDASPPIAWLPVTLVVAGSLPLVGCPSAVGLRRSTVSRG